MSEVLQLDFATLSPPEVAAAIGFVTFVAIYKAERNLRLLKLFFKRLDSLL